MRKRTRLRHDGQTRANNVATEHSAILDAEPGVQTTRLALGTYVADVDGLLALQQRSLEERHAATVQLRKSRGTLRNAAKAVARVGTLIDPEDDALMGSMKLPGGVSDDELIAYTRGMLDRVTPHADAFVKGGLPANLLKNFADAIQQFVATKDLRDATVQRFQSATESIRETQDKADKAIDAIEAVALNLPAANPEFVRKLRIARRVGPRTVATPEKPVETPEKPASPTTPPSDSTNKVA
jgi:hypothetical protein